MDDLLSQDEISALLAGGDVGGDMGSALSSSDSEFLDKVAEIFATAENNVIGMLAGKSVDVSLEGSEVITQEELRGKMDEVPFIFSATFGGFEDAPLALLIEQKGALTLADLMMGGGGTDLPEPSDLYWNAAQEGLSQVVGSAFTSLSGLLLSGIERMTLRADLYMDIFLCRTCYELITTVTYNLSLIILRMDSFAHLNSPLPNKYS